MIYPPQIFKKICKQENKMFNFAASFSFCDFVQRTSQNPKGAA